ncbi:MAG: oligopeptidase B, partial [Candidatus Zixiibacteriota bacterium]
MSFFRSTSSRVLFICGAVVTMSLAVRAQQPTPPVAPIHPHSDTLFGVVRVDNYAWLRDRDNPEVLEYLKAENAYADAMMKHAEPLREKFYKEIFGRIQESDLSVPVRHGDYFY